MKKKKQKKTDAAGKYTRPAAGPGGSGPGISSGPYGGAQQLPALQTIPFQPLQIQQEPMQPLPLAPGCERGASRGTKERTPADPAGKCGATFEQSENGVASTLPPAGATTGQRGFAQRNGAERRQAPPCSMRDKRPRGGRGAASGACGRKQKGDAGMTLGEAKSEVLKLLDETKPKADLTGKLDRFFDMGQKEVALYYPIWREKTYAAEDEKTLPQDCCKPRYVIVDGIAHPYTKYSQLPDAFTLRYEAYPADIPDNAPDETEFDLPDEAVLAVIFFAAAQTQSMEYDQRFFQSFYAQYQGKLSNLSGQADGPAAVVTGGCNV